MDHDIGCLGYIMDDGQCAGPNYDAFLAREELSFSPESHIYLSNKR